MGLKLAVTWLQIAKTYIIYWLDYIHLAIENNEIFIFVFCPWNLFSGWFIH